MLLSSVSSILQDSRCRLACRHSVMMLTAGIAERAGIAHAFKGSCASPGVTSGRLPW